MNISKEFLDCCTKEQINKGVAWRLASKFNIYDANDRRDGSLILWYGIRGKFNYYCTNPIDAWPIILSEGIGLSPQGEWWEAYGKQIHEIGHFGSKYRHRSKEPFVSAMIVYLLSSNS